MRSVKKQHTVESLLALNNGRFERRVAFYLINDREKDCWLWIGTWHHRLNTGMFPVQDLVGRQVSIYARRYAWGYEFPHQPLQPGERLIKVASCVEERCISPYHMDRANSSPEKTVKIRIETSEQREARLARSK